jgi:hypothetical protein
MCFRWWRAWHNNRLAYVAHPAVYLLNQISVIFRFLGFVEVHQLPKRRDGPSFSVARLSIPLRIISSGFFWFFFEAMFKKSIDQWSQCKYHSPNDREAISIPVYQALKIKLKKGFHRTIKRRAATLALPICREPLHGSTREGSRQA